MKYSDDGAAVVVVDVVELVTTVVVGAGGGGADVVGAVVTGSPGMVVTVGEGSALELDEEATVSGAPLVVARATAAGPARSGDGRLVTSSRTLETAEVVSTIEAIVAASQAAAVTSFLRISGF